MTGFGRAHGRHHHARHALQTAAVSDDRPVQVLRLEPARLRPLNITEGFAHSSDTFFYQLAGDARHRPARLLGAPVGLRPEDRHRPARRGDAASSRPTTGSRASSASTSIPGEVYQAGIGQGYDAATPLQVLNAYTALANGGTLYKPQIVRRVLAPDGSVVQDFQPQVIQQVGVSPGHAADDAPRGARGRDEPGTRTTS